MSAEADGSGVRLDKWLWAVRLFKTRGLALEACRGGHVKLEGHNLKPAHLVRIGQVFEIRKEARTLKVKVKGLIHQRVGAALVAEYLEDLSPPEPVQSDNVKGHEGYRPAGSGRPTKRERRLLDAFLQPPPIED